MNDVTREGQHAVVLFDGVCNLCNGAVNFTIDHDPDAYFRFAALQSEAAQRLLDRCGVKPEATLESVVLVENGRCYRRSGAVLRVARRLGLPWSLAWGFIAVPRPWRDAVYSMLARSRYDWFGRRDACRMPTPELQERFLGAAEL